MSNEYDTALDVFAVLDKSHLLKKAEELLLDENREMPVEAHAAITARATALIALHQEWRLAGGEKLEPIGPSHPRPPIPTNWPRGDRKDGR